MRGSPWHAYRADPLSTERGREAHLDSVKLTMPIILLLFGGGFGYRRYGYGGGIGLGGILLIILILYLLFGRGGI